MHQRVHTRRKITVSNEGGRRDDESSGSREQTFVNAGGQFRHRGIAAIRCDNAEGFNHSRNCAEQSKQGRKIGQSSEDTEEALQFGYFQLTGFLDDFAQFRSREIMPDDCGVNHARHRPGCAGGFMQGFSKIAALDQVGQPLQELAHVNGGAMQIKKPLFDHGPPSSAFWASSQARAGGRQCDLTTSEHQSMAQLVFNRRKQRERRLLSFSEVEGRALRARRRRAPPSRLVQEQAAESFVSSLPSVWFVTSVSSVTGSTRRFGRGVFPRHRKSSNRSDARRRRSEKRSCRSRSGLWPDAFPRPGDYYCRICFAG